MTMRITVKNEDKNRTAEVLEEQFPIGKTEPDFTDSVLLAPGEERSFWIHAARRITVTEKP